MKTATLTEFAALRGVHKSTVTRYKQADRLVFTDDGLIDVDASNKRIKDTADPNRDDVVRRHAEKKNKTYDIGSDDNSASYQASRAKKEKYLALQAKADYEKSIGELVERDQVQRDWTNVAIIMRSALERVPDLLSAELASESDHNRVHAILVENIESALKQASEQIKDSL